jgi:hypothetical protein
LKHFDGKSPFYDEFLVPLVKKCKNDDFDPEILKDTSPMKAEKKRFCDNVKNMYGLFIQMNGVMQNLFSTKNTKNQELEIRKLVFEDLLKFKVNYDDKLLSRIDIDQIKGEVNKIAEHCESGKKEFKKSVDALEAELDKISAAADEGQKQNIISAADKLAYKMLLIGEKMYGYEWTEELRWAYRQFAANSLVYAIRLDARKSDEHGKIQKGDIQQIAHDHLVHIRMAT